MAKEADLKTDATEAEFPEEDKCMEPFFGDDG